MSVGSRDIVFVLFVVISTALSVAYATEKSTKSSSTQTDNSAFKMFDLSCLSDLAVTDYLRVGSMIVGFLAILFWDRRASTFANAEIVIYAFFGFHAYFAPAAVLDFATVGTTNNVHEYMVQVVGALYLSAAFYRYKMSNDGSMRFNYGILALLETVGFLAVTIYAHIKYTSDNVHLTKQHGIVCILGLILLGLGHAIHLYRQGFGDGNRSAIITKTILNQHLLFDGFIYIMAGCFYFGFPDLSFKGLDELKDFKPDGMMESIVRFFGVAEMVMGLSSILALGTNNDDDKKTILTHRLVFLGLYLPLIFLYQWKYHYVSFKNFVGFIILIAAIGGNSICALYLRSKKKLM